MRPAFEIALYFVFEMEGLLSDKDPDDPGGITNYGVTVMGLRASGIDVDGDGKIDSFDVKGLTPGLAVKVYRTAYWDFMGLNEEKDWLFAIAIFDTAVNVGTTRTKRWVSMVKDKENRIDELLRLRTEHYLRIIARNPVLKKYQRGWLRRVNELKKYLKIMKDNHDQNV